MKFWSHGKTSQENLTLSDCAARAVLTRRLDPRADWNVTHDDHTPLGADEAAKLIQMVADLIHPQPEETR